MPFHISNAGSNTFWLIYNIFFDIFCTLCCSNIFTYYRIVEFLYLTLSRIEQDTAVLACSFFSSTGYSNPTPVGPFDVAEKRLCSQDAWRQRLELFVQDLALAEAIRCMMEGGKR